MRAAEPPATAPSSSGVWWSAASRTPHWAISGTRWRSRCAASPASGTPLDLTVEVRRLDANHAQTGLGGTPSPLGDSAWVRTGGIDLVLTSLRSQPFYADGFTGLGVALENKKIIVVKSMQHFMAGFGSLAAQVLYVTTPGAIPPELDRLPYTKRTTPFWPQVENPFDR